MSLPAHKKYIDSGQEWLGAVPAHWTVKRLGHFFDERRERASDTEFEPLSVTMKGIVPRLETAAKTQDGDNRKKVVKGDFVINSRSDRKGSSGVAPMDGSVSLICIVAKPKGIEPVYAHHLLRSVPFQEEFYRNGKGIVADLWSTGYSEMKNIVIPVPTADEQQQIACFLDHETAKIDALIAEQQRLIELLKEKRQAVISHAVTKGLNPNAPMKDSGVEWLGEVPAHWEVAKLSAVTTKITNGYVGPTRDLFHDSGVVYLQSLHIKNNKIVFSPEYYVSREWSQAHSKSILKAGDVLIVQTGDIGQSAVVTEDHAGANCHALIVVSTVREVLSGGWLAWVMNSSYGKGVLLSIQTGALHPHLNCGNVKDVKIPIPPANEQSLVISHIEKSISQFDELIDEARGMAEMLKERRGALISAAVTGKIDVRSWQADTALSTAMPMATEEAAQSLQ